MTSRRIVLDANILIRAVLGDRVRLGYELVQRDRSVRVTYRTKCKRRNRHHESDETHNRTPHASANHRQGLVTRGHRWVHDL